MSLERNFFNFRFDFGVDFPDKFCPFEEFFGEFLGVSTYSGDNILIKSF